MPKFIPYNYDQSKMVMVNYQDQLQPGTFEHAIHVLVGGIIDVSAFHARYNNDVTGRFAYDPAILLKIILFAYSKGITSSREIQWCCETNIIFKALSCDTVPHFTTIADFISSSSTQIEAFFEAVLLTCHDQGLLGNELFAIDGCKMRSDAAKQWSGTIKELENKRDKLKRQIAFQLSEHRKMDEAEANECIRKARTQQTIETLQASHDKIDAFLAKESPRMGKGKRQREVKSNITDNESAKMSTSKGTIQGYNGLAAVDSKHQIIISAEAIGSGPEQHTLTGMLEDIDERYQKLAISDDIYADGVKVTADTGFSNEENMQYLYENNIDAFIPDKDFRSRDPKFVDAKSKYTTIKTTPSVFTFTDFTYDAIKQTCVCPAGKLMCFRGIRKDRDNKPRSFFEGRLTDCRHCELKEKCMTNPAAADNRKGHGKQVTFIQEDQCQPTYMDWMIARVDSQYGKEIYSHRMSVVEPVFANIGSNKRLSKFSLRTKAKVQGQWKLYCIVHNLEKLMNYGELAA